MFFADMLRLFNPGGKVITIDIEPEVVPVHESIVFLRGSSVSETILDAVRELVSGKVMVVLDSSHRARHVYNEILSYGPMVTKGQYLVVEDIYRKRGGEQKLHWPAAAADKFMAETNHFIRDPIWEKYGSNAGSTREGWLLRVR